MSKPRMNEQITAETVKVIVGPKRKIVGTMPIAEALMRAKKHKYDLLEIRPDLTPPVCLLRKITVKVSYEPVTDDDVVNLFPAPISVVYKDMLDEDDGNRKLRALVKVFATSLKYLALLLMNQYLEEDRKDSDINILLSTKMLRPSLGHWNNILRDMLNYCGSNRKKLWIPEMLPFYFLPNRRATANVKIIDELISLRNKFCHSDIFLPDSEAKQVFGDNLPRLKQFLTSQRFLCDYKLVLAGENPDAAPHGELPGAIEDKGVYLLRPNQERAKLHPLLISSSLSEDQNFVYLYESFIGRPDKEKAEARFLLGNAEHIDSLAPAKYLRQTFIQLEKATRKTTKQTSQGVADGKLDWQQLMLDTGDKLTAAIWHEGLSEKYKSNLYVERREIEDPIGQFIEQDEATALLVVADAGYGKTNLLAHLALKHRGISPPEEAQEQTYEPEEDYGDELDVSSEFEQDLPEADTEIDEVDDSLLEADDSYFGNASQPVSSEDNDPHEAHDDSSAEKPKPKSLVVFLTGRDIVKQDFESSISEKLGVEKKLSELFTLIDNDQDKGQRNVLILMDAINENPRPSQLLDEICLFAKNFSKFTWLKLIVTCRSIVWDMLERNKHLQQYYPFFYKKQMPGGFMQPFLYLKAFTDQELQDAYAKYSSNKEFAISTKFEEVSSQARKVMRNPLMLRLVCEAYSGNAPEGVGKLPREVLSLKVFNTYFRNIEKNSSDRFMINDLVSSMWMDKTDRVRIGSNSIIQKQPELEQLRKSLSRETWETSSPMIRIIERVLEDPVYEQCGDSDDRSTLIRLRDEGVIQQLEDEGFSLYFTYEKLFEYMLGRFIHDSLVVDSDDPAQTIASIVLSDPKNTQVWGAAVTAIRLHHDRSLIIESLLFAKPDNILEWYGDFDHDSMQQSQRELRKLAIESIVLIGEENWHAAEPLIHSAITKCNTEEIQEHEQTTFFSEIKEAILEAAYRIGTDAVSVIAELCNDKSQYVRTQVVHYGFLVWRKSPTDPVDGKALFRAFEKMILFNPLSPKSSLSQIKSVLQVLIEITLKVIVNFLNQPSVISYILEYWRGIIHDRLKLKTLKGPIARSVMNVIINIGANVLAKKVEGKSDDEQSALQRIFSSSDQEKAEMMEVFKLMSQDQDGIEEVSDTLVHFAQTESRLFYFIINAVLFIQGHKDIKSIAPIADRLFREGNTYTKYTVNSALHFILQECDKSKYPEYYEKIYPMIEKNTIEFLEGSRNEFLAPTVLDDPSIPFTPLNHIIEAQSWYQNGATTPEDDSRSIGAIGFVRDLILEAKHNNRDNDARLLWRCIRDTATHAMDPQSLFNHFPENALSTLKYVVMTPDLSRNELSDLAQRFNKADYELIESELVRMIAILQVLYPERVSSFIDDCDISPVLIQRINKSIDQELHEFVAKLVDNWGIADAMSSILINHPKLSRPIVEYIKGMLNFDKPQEYFRWAISDMLNKLLAA